MISKDTLGGLQLLDKMVMLSLFALGQIKLALPLRFISFLIFHLIVLRLHGILLQNIWGPIYGPCPR